MTSLRPTTRVARGATYLFIQGVASTVISLVYFVVLARILSQEEMGVFTLLSFILSLPQIFGTFALPSAAIKYISKYLAENDTVKAKSVAVRVLQICLFSSVVAFLFLFVPAEWLSVQIFSNPSYASLIRITSLCSVFAVLNVVAGGLLQGLQRIRDVATLSLVYTVAQNAVGIFLLSIGLGLYAVVLGWLAGLSFASITGLIITAKYLGVLGKPHPIKPLFSFSLPLYVSSGVGYFVTWADQLILVSYMSLLYGSTEAQRILGIYHVAIWASVVPGLFSGSIITALFPQLSELYTKQGSGSLKDAFRVSARYAVLIGFPLIVGVAALAYPIIILFAGFRYGEAALPLTIISLGALVGTLGIAIGPILMTLERTKIASVLSIVSVGFSVFLSYSALAILGLGMVGTAWARTFASIITLVLSLYAVTRYVPVSFDKETIWKASVASILMVIAIIGLDAVRMILSPSSYQFLVFSLRLLPIYVIVGALAYFVSLVALRAIKKRDVELIYEYLPKNMKWVADWLARIAMVE